ncbi:MAG: DUF5110 domain-containing protein [Acidobacteriia bacterium]|nr:DUF5110 domain-containing protein [Terriglobia bacterium]
MSRTKDKSSKKNLSRREALARLGAAGTGALLARGMDQAMASVLQDEQPRPLEIAGQRAGLELTVVSPHTLRISVLPLGEDGRSRPAEPDPVLIERNWPEPALKIQSRGGAQRKPWGELAVIASSQPLAITVRGEKGRIIPRLLIESDGVVSFPRGVAPLFGLGEGGPQFDRGGKQYPMRNGQNVPELAVVGARMPIPLIASADGWALFFHQPYGTFDLTGEDARFNPLPSETALPLDLFLITSKNPAEILAEYARLTGFPHLPPLWSLGYQQSHRTLSSREEILTEARTFREKKLPCDVLIYLGTGFCPSGWNTGHGSFSFNKQVFPDPEEMIRELHKENFRIVPHVVLQARHLHGRVSDTGEAAQAPEDVAHYWAEHLKVFDTGVDGWWPDEGDWLPPLDRLVRNRMYWEGPLQARPNVRPYALHRNGYAGIQRYGWLWSGDVESTWRTLQAQVPNGINTGLSGMPFWGTDTGGFVTTPELTGELYVRWFQFSSFCPLFRSHGRTWKLRLPWGWNTGDYGPTELGGYHGDAGLPDPRELHNAEVEPICRKYLDLRYRLMPYLYTAVREAHATGLPIMRALWLHYADDPHAVERGDEYLWGRNILVAPVTEKGATERRLYLPRGRWYDFWTEEPLEGGRELARPVDLATLPLYVRAGTIIPMAPVKQYTAQESREPLTFVIYPGADAEFALYEDDGVSFDYSRGEFMLLRAGWNDGDRQLALSLVEGSKLLPPRPRTFEIRVASSHQSQSVTFDGTAKTVKL